MDYLKLKQRIKQLLGIGTTPPPAPDPDPEPKPEPVEIRQGFTPGEGAYPGLCGNSHQRRIERRKQARCHQQR